MKVKVLTRNPDYYLRETKRDLHKLPRNYDPSLHPFEAAREYVRALNAVKLERVFAKPFIGSLDGHRDGVSCLGKHPKALGVLASGSYDGEVRLWDLSQKVCLRTIQAHEGYVRGIAFTPDGSRFLTIGDDTTIRTWNSEKPSFGEVDEPISTIINKTSLFGITHHREEPKFVTCGELCQMWEEGRHEPIRSFNWGHDSLHYAAFNPIESFILGTCGSDRSVVIYDTRKVGPVSKVTMSLRTNQLCWNPMEAFIFTCANEDYNLYTFDTRNLRYHINIHKDHVSAVTSVDYSPTGREFVSGGYDKSIRLYFANKSHSRDIYHTKRMQHVTNVLWSLDDKYVISASDEMNVRIWKARASEKLGILTRREKNALEYNEALKKKFESHPQIKRIARHRQIPTHIYNEQKIQRAQKDKIQRKQTNVRKHSKPGSVPFVPERKKNIVEVHE